MAHQVYREEVVLASDARILTNSTPDYYVLIWDEERPENGTIKLEHYANGRLFLSIWEPAAEEPREGVVVPHSAVSEGLESLLSAASESTAR